MFGRLGVAAQPINVPLGRLGSEWSCPPVPSTTPKVMRTFAKLLGSPVCALFTNTDIVLDELASPAAVPEGSRSPAGALRVRVNCSGTQLVAVASGT